MRSFRVIAAALISALLAIPLAASPAVAKSPTALGNTSCDSALTALGKVQVRKTAPAATLNNALAACSFDDPQYPAARFLTVKYGKRTIGGVFAVTGENTLLLANQPNTVSVLLNGHGLSTPRKGDKYFVKGKTVTVNLGEGKTVTGKMEASIGDGGSSIRIKTSERIGSPNEGLQLAASNPLPAVGTPVTVYTERGPKKTVVGPVYEREWATLDAVAYGTVVRDADGAAIGTSGEFGTGLTEAEYNFWENRSYFTPLYTP